MAPRGKAYVVRRLILTVVATVITITLCSSNNELFNRKNSESSLQRRRLFSKEESSPKVHSTQTSHPTIDPHIEDVTPKNEKEEEENFVTPFILIIPQLSSPSGVDKSEENEPLEDNENKKPSKVSKSEEATESEESKPSESTGNGKDKEKELKETEHKEKENGAHGEEDIGNHQAVPGTTARPRKDPSRPNLHHKLSGKGQLPPQPVVTTTESNENEPPAVPIEIGCTPPAYHEFPPDLFTHKQRSRGAVVIHIAVIIYMFYAVAVVCDDYFIASLEECCSRLNMSEDVAGATFMAAGSSAPELFTAILGVLVAKGDVGTGTIVGSAVFNVLFVIGICGIFSGRVVELTWWPLFRDSVFYSATVILLIAIIFDSEVTWYESVIMMLIYGVYIILMKFNSDVHFWVSRKLGIEDESAQNVGILAQGDKKTYSSYVPFNNEIDECASMPVTAHYSMKKIDPDESIRQSNRLSSIHEAALVFMMMRQFRSTTRFRSAAIRIILEQRRLRIERSKLQGQISIESQDSTHKWKPKSIGASMGLTAESNWKSLPTREEGFCRLIKWIIQAPLLATLHYTIPDCRKEKLQKFFLLTFFSSIMWTALFSYVMVWMVTLVGYTLGIPDSIMGITFLAAGTSVPDAFASLIVARQGQGDMAVSNSLGSNIFDILIGLALPWFIQTVIIEPGSIAVINSRGMVYSVVLLFLTIIIAIGGISMSQWQLTRRLGITLISVYVVFLVISILLEFNVLGYVNPPMCQE